MVNLDFKIFFDFFRLFFFHFKRVLLYSSIRLNIVFFKYIALCIFFYLEILFFVFFLSANNSCSFRRVNNLSLNSSVLSVLSKNIDDFSSTFNLFMNGLDSVLLGDVFLSVHSDNVFLLLSSINSYCIVFRSYFFSLGQEIVLLFNLKSDLLFLESNDLLSFFHKSRCIVSDFVFRNSLLSGLPLFLNELFGASFIVTVKKGFFDKGYLYIPHYLSWLSSLSKENMLTTYYLRAIYLYAQLYYIYMDYLSIFDREGLLLIINKYFLLFDNDAFFYSNLFYNYFFEVIEHLIYFLYLPWYLKKYKK